MKDARLDSRFFQGATELYHSGLDEKAARGFFSIDLILRCKSKLDQFGIV